MYFKTEGIVLREVEINEADKLLDILTADRGLVTAKARGVRRSRSELKSACQLLAYSDFTIFEYRDKLTVQEAEPIEQFRQLRDELELFALGSYFAQAVSAVAQEDAPNPELLQLICNALYALSRLKKPQLLVKAAFELRLTRLAGFEPELEACCVCGAPEPTRFDLSLGQVFCADCHPGGAEGIRFPLSGSMLQAMRYICWCDPKRLFSFRLDDDTLRELSALTEGYLMTQLEHSFSTLDFYKSLLQYGDYHD